MNNIILKSIFYILFCFILVTSVVFLANNNYSITVFISTLKYIFYEEKGLVIFLSQFIFIVSKSKRSTSNILLNAFVCWIVYNLIYNFGQDFNFFPNRNIPNEIYINRGYLSENSFNILDLTIIKQFLLDIKNWKLVDFSYLSSFIIIIFIGYFVYFFYEFFSKRIIVKFFSFILIFLFLLYFWNFNYNITLFILSIVLLKSRRKKN